MTKSFFSLPDLLMIKVWGQDSERYLNNRLSNNVKSLVSIPACQPTAALSAQGKTEALLMLLKTAKDQFMLFSDGTDHDSIIKNLFRYKVADRFNYEKVNDNCCALHLLDTNFLNNPEYCRTTLEQLQKIVRTKIISYCCYRTEELGLDLTAYCPAATLTQALGELGYKQISNDKAQLLRFMAKIPSFPTEINDKYLLQEANPKGSYSTNKGCYVGQEVTQKVDSFAKLPFKLAFLKASSDNQSQNIDSTALYSDVEKSLKVGEIISYTKDKENLTWLAFARIKNQPYAEQRLYTEKLSFELGEIFDFSLGARECFYLE